MSLIIPLFINHRGCRQRCIFCNEHITAGGPAPPLTEEYIRETITTYLTASRKRGHVELALYGGTFTGLPLGEQEAILRRLEPYISQGIITGIRISTRPDDIDDENIRLLAQYGVKTVELGAQSLDDEVLRFAARGHRAKHVTEAVTRLKSHGFFVGLHLMMGLPGDHRETFRTTVEKTIALRPHMVRIHPTLVLAATPLARYYREGRYTPLSMEEALSGAAEAVRRFQQADIPVIRLGLQATKELEQPGNIVAGPFHPAFGALVKSRLLYEQAADLLRQHPHARDVVFQVPPREESPFRGQRNENLRRLAAQFGLRGVTIVAGETLVLQDEMKRCQVTFPKGKRRRTVVP